VRQNTRSPAGTRSLSLSADWQRPHLVATGIVVAGFTSAMMGLPRENLG
jgi:hypothetical protein